MGEKIMELYARNLRKRLADIGMTQAELARYMHVSSATASDWCNGKKLPRDDKKTQICELLRVDFSDLFRATQVPKAEGVRIPVYGRVAAGVPLEMIADITDEEEIPAAMLVGGKEYFALRIKGDSMSPRMVDGDIVIVRKQDTIESGDIAIVTINGDDATCKRVILSPQGIMLQSLNPAYPPIFYDAEQAAALPVAILGKVVELRGKI